MEKNNLQGFTPYAVSLNEMMAERERRADKSSLLIQQNKGKTVICMTMNLVGEYKQLALSHAAFCHHFKLVKLALSCIHAEAEHLPTGDVAFFITDVPAQTAKMLCERIEDNGTIGRLFDIDVFDSQGVKLSRNTPRKCMLCERNAAECARSRAHGVEKVRERTQQILSSFFASDITAMALDALIEEVDTTPKPGLVDRNNSGANPDMSYNMFIKSAEAIALYMGKIFEIASSFSSIDSKLAEAVRSIGITAEAAMYKATGGVNTHKGAIYSIGLLSAGIGFTLSYGGSFTDAVDAAAQLALELSYTVTDTQTHGLAMCKKYGVTGARGEAIGGFHTVLYAFERIKHYIDDCGLDSNTAYPLAINDVMSVMKDTNVLHRAGMDGLEFLHREAREIGEMRENQRIDDMLQLDKDLIERNISPGGCADALACALFLLKAEKLFDGLRRCYDKA